MILTLAVLFLQFPAIPHNWKLQAFSNLPEAANAVAGENAIKTAAPAPSASDTPVSAIAPPAEVPKVPSAMLPSESLVLNSNPPMRDSRASALSLSPRDEFGSRLEESRRRKWLALVVAYHGAATFDAWSTRQAISLHQAQEMNPTLRPFASNASLYAAIQAGPLLFDYVGRRMMTSQHTWMRRTWWVPQTVGIVMSLGSGARNLSIH